MSPLLRRVFFWALTLIFLVTTPALILFFIGYRYSIERGIFIYTGSVSIQANPTQNLDIHLDGKPVSSETNRLNRSYHIEGIVPGTHRISVSAPGFSTWSKEITVRSGIATEFWNVLLARDRYEQKSIPLLEGSVAFFPSPNGNQIVILSKSNDETTLDVLDTTTGSRRQVFSTTNFSPETNLSEKSVRWDPRDSTRLFATLDAKDTGEQHVFIIQTDTSAATDLKDIVRVPHPHAARWNPNADTFFFLSGTTLFNAPLDTPLQEIKLSENIESYDIVGDIVFSLEPNTGILYRFPVGNPEQKKQVTTAPPEEFSGKYTAPFSLTVYDETRIAIINNETSDLFLYNKSDQGERFKKLSSDAKGFQFSDDGKKLLYWTDWEIFAVFTRKWEVQPVRNEGDRLDIGRFSSMIDHVQWAKDYEHILFSSGKDVKTTELDDRGGRDTVTLLTLPTPPLQISAIGSKNEIFSLFPDKDPTNPPLLSSITFPEPIGLFGFGG